ncbi:MAG: Hsp20/alpha crystallin family protein [Bacteroidota bacterium]
MTRLVRHQRLFPEMPSMFSGFFDDDNFFNRNFRDSMISTVPAANVFESDTAFQIELAVPGMTKEDFNVNIENGSLIVSAESKQEVEEKEDQATRKEFSYSAFTRTFVMPESVNTEKIKAKYEDGLLKLTLPKREEAKQVPKRQIDIS